MSETNHPIPTASVTSPPTKKRRRKLIWLGSGAAAALLLVIILLSLGSSSAIDAGLPTATVCRGCMIVSVSETGDIVAEEQETISNQVRWPIIIKEAAPEGKYVEKGQTIIRMECKDLDDALLDQELRVRSAEDDEAAASTKEVVTSKTMGAKILKAKTAVEDAANDLKKYEEAEWPQKKDDALSAITMAQRDLTLAQSKLDAKLKINADPELKKPYSDNEIKAEELSVQRLQLQLSKAETDKEILINYTHPRTLRDKKNGVSDAQLDLETTELDAETQIRLSETGEESAKDRLTKQRNRLKDLQSDAEKLHIKAKQRGLVVYESRRNRWDNPVTVAVDEKINANQQLMIIPNMNTLQIQTRVYEAVREQVTPGQQVLIRLDIRRGQVIQGTVKKVAPLPDSQNPWLSPGVKVYPTVVEFSDIKDTEGLKPGMTADCEMILATLDSVLSVPIAAVFSENDSTFCFRVKGPGQYDRVGVKVGKTSDTRAEILAGLGEGETVLLAPPPGQVVGGKLADRSRSDVASRPSSRPSSRPASTQPGDDATSQPTSQPTSQRADATTRPASDSRPSEATTQPADRTRRRRDSADDAPRRDRSRVEPPSSSEPASGPTSRLRVRRLRDESTE